MKRPDGELIFRERIRTSFKMKGAVYPSPPYREWQVARVRTVLHRCKTLAECREWAAKPENGCPDHLLALVRELPK